MVMLVIFKDWRVFQDKILEENLVQSAFHQTLGDTFTFQQNNNLKHKDKSALELLDRKTVNVPE